MFSGKSVMLEGFNEELKEAEAMVKEISEEQVSLLMLKAMAGYPIFLKGRGRGIQLREGRDESVQDSEANTLCSFASVPILA